MSRSTAPAAPPLGPPWVRAPMTRAQLDGVWLTSALAMAACAALFFGWRGLLQVALSTAICIAVYLLLTLAIYLVRPSHRFDSPAHTFTLALLVGVLHPLTLNPWQPMLAAVLLGVAMHLVGRIHACRAHPLALAITLAWFIPFVSSQLELHQMQALGQEPAPAVLRINRLVLGDVLDYADPGVYEPWWTRPAHPDEPDALPRLEPGEVLVKDQQTMLLYPQMLVHMLTSGELPRLEELLIGCVPGPMGATSRLLLILLGLYLMTRRLSWWPQAAGIVLAALVTLLLMPVQGHDQVQLALWRLADFSPAVAGSYLSYFLLASPLLLTALVLAPMSDPMSGPGKLLYALLIGAFGVGLQWILQVPQAWMAALLIASLLSRPLDALRLGGFH